MITIVMSNTIAASPQRVWRALTSPNECVAWDESLIEAVDPPSSYPRVGQQVRWRSRLGSMPVLMHDRPQAVVPYRRLHSHISIGSLRFDQTFTLAPEQEPDAEGGEDKTRLGMKVVASNSVAVIGAIVDRFEIRQMTVDRVDAALRSITKWCEVNP